MKEPADACPPGETMVPLKPIEIELREKPKPDPVVADLERRLRDLEARLSDKARMLDRKVEAPFEVVNEAGVKVFSVEEESLGERSVNVFNDAGKRVAWLYGSDERGWMRTMSATSDLFAEITPDGFSVRNHDLGRHRVDLGRINHARHGLRLFNVNEKMVAGIGQSEAESGIVVIADADGKRRFGMRTTSATNAAGKVQIVNAQEVEIASLSVDERQNGLLQLRNGDGVTMVEAGTLDTGVGVVRAGPGAFQHGIGFLGLPGSYIQGKPQ